VITTACPGVYTHDGQSVGGLDLTEYSGIEDCATVARSDIGTKPALRTRLSLNGAETGMVCAKVWRARAP